MRLYISSHCPELAKEAAKKLTEAGHEIVSTWHSGDNTTSLMDHAEEARRAASLKNEDQIVYDSAALILISGPDKYPGGKFVEAGIAIASGVPVICIGRRENWLLWHPGVWAVDSIEDYINRRPDGAFYRTGIAGQ
jgi:hypothetical protein